MDEPRISADLIKDEDFWKSEGKPNATRASSGTMLNRIAACSPISSAEVPTLHPSNKSLMKDREYYSPANRAGSNFHFGIRVSMPWRLSATDFISTAA